MQKTYKFRLYPTKEQEKAIDETIEKCRQLYNELLTLKKEAYKKRGVNLTRKDLYKQVKGNKKVHSQVSQNVAERIDKAFKNFFRRVKLEAKKKGLPRFKKYGQYRSITLPQIIDAEQIGKKTYFPKIGWINTKYHRGIEGTPKTMTIKKARSGKYFITICCVCRSKKPIERSEREVGIDLGLNHFIATSDGKFFEHPKPMKQLSEKRRVLARRFSKTKKGSRNREKARIKLARVDEKIANIRDDFSWKLCNMLIREYGIIYVEDLDIREMQKNHYLAGAITDVSWNGFLQKLFYKAESAGGKVVKVNPKNTTQTCSACGRVVKKTLFTRIHICPYCRLILDRDINSAQNILAKGRIGQELSKSTPVGDEASTVGVDQWHASSMNQEVPCVSKR